MQGKTRLLLTRIPFFREIILSSFSCDECGHSDTSIQSAGKVQDRGHRLTLNVEHKKVRRVAVEAQSIVFNFVSVQDLDRQVVKSNTAVFAIPSLEFEQEPNKEKGG